MINHDAVVGFCWFDMLLLITFSFTYTVNSRALDWWPPAAFRHHKLQRLPSRDIIAQSRLFHMRNSTHLRFQTFRRPNLRPPSAAIFTAGDCTPCSSSENQRKSGSRNKFQPRSSIPSTPSNRYIPSATHVINSTSKRAGTPCRPVAAAPASAATPCHRPLPPLQPRIPATTRAAR